MRDMKTLRVSYDRHNDALPEVQEHKEQDQDVVPRPVLNLLQQQKEVAVPVPPDDDGPDGDDVPVDDVAAMREEIRSLNRMVNSLIGQMQTLNRCVHSAVNHCECGGAQEGARKAASQERPSYIA